MRENQRRRWEEQRRLEDDLELARRIQEEEEQQEQGEILVEPVTRRSRGLSLPSVLRTSRALQLPRRRDFRRDLYGMGRDDPFDFARMDHRFPSMLDHEEDDFFRPFNSIQQVFQFGGNTIIFPPHGAFGGMGGIGGMGGVPMSYEELLNLQSVATPAKNRDQLPQYSYKKPEKSSNEKSTDSPATDCSICLTEYTDGDSIKALPCTHRFHLPCIDKWLEAHNTCPVCKTQVDK